MIRSIHISNFMGIRNASIVLQDAPIHVITGASGAGKSTIIDAVNWVLWGSCYRRQGDPVPAGRDVAPEVVIDMKGFRVLRRGATRTNMVVTADGNTVAIADTQRKALEVMTEVVGPKRPWQVGSIISTDDLAFFAASTDQQRKEFLEEALGLSMFAFAEEVLKGKVRACEATISRATQAIDTSRCAISDIEASLLRLSAQIGPEPEKPKTPSKELLASRDAIDLGAAHSKIAEAASKMDRLRSVKEAIANGQCPLCKSDTHAIVPTVEAKYADAVKELEAAKDELQQLQQLRSSLHAEWEAALTAEQAIAAWRTAHDRILAHKQDLTAMKEARLATIEESQRLIAETTEASALAKKAAAVCAPKGVRTYFLEYILPIIEQTANAYLGILGAPFQLALSIKVTAAGASTIDLGVIGAGGGAFWASSEGERQRMALCLRLALSACIGHGHDLFLDEVYSHLDDSHLDGFVALLNEVSRDRAVVLITHDQGVASAVGGKRYVMEDGVLSAV